MLSFDGLELRREDRLMALCARTRLSDEAAASVRSLLGQGLDWEYLLRRAPAHGVMPLLYRNLSTLCPELLPDDALASLRDFCDHNTRRNLVLTGELRSVLTMLSGEGIQVIPLKGPLLAESAYGHLGLRQMADLDILVHSTNVLRTKDILNSRGYQPFEELTRAQEAAVLRHDCEYPLWRLDPEVVVEIHWRITPKTFPFPLNAQLLAQRLRPSRLGPASIAGPGPEDLLLILCVHSTKHMWTKLSWVCDVAEVIRAYEDIDWGELFRRARQLHCQRALELGLSLAASVLDAELPDAIARRLEGDLLLQRLTMTSCELLFKDWPRGPRGLGWPGLLDRSLYYMRTMERKRDRLNYFARFLFTPTDEDWEGLRLPDPLFPLYYLYRPLRMTKWLARWLWRRATARRSPGEDPKTEGAWLETR